jgi:hypothetical protein
MKQSKAASNEVKPYGLYGCACHPFNDWAECDREHKKKLAPGDAVKDRHTGKTGTVVEKREKGFYRVKYGPLPGDIEPEHAANLILLKNSTQNESDKTT